MIHSLKSRYDLEEGYNTAVARSIRPVTGDIPTALVGGMHTLFEWNQGNLTKNWDQHDVSSGECEQIFFNRPLIIKGDKEHSKNENRYYVLGRTNVNRLLFAVFTVRNDKIRILSARDMTDTEIKRYLK